MATRNPLVVKKGFRAIRDEKLMVGRKELLRRTLVKVKEEAQRIADTPTSAAARGRASGRLHNSIKVYAYEPGYNVSKTWWHGEVRVDETMTKVPDSAHGYAFFQEVGTGKFGIHRKPIRATNHKVMKWLNVLGRKEVRRKGVYEWQEYKGGLYRGTHVYPKFMGTVETSKGRGKQRRRKIEEFYLQFATEVEGAKPKHFMRDAGKNPEIRAFLKDGLHKLTLATAAQAVSKQGS